MFYRHSIITRIKTTSITHELRKKQFYRHSIITRIKTGPAKSSAGLVGVLSPFHYNKDYYHLITHFV